MPKPLGSSTKQGHPKSLKNDILEKNSQQQGLSKNLKKSLTKVSQKSLKQKDQNQSIKIPQKRESNRGKKIREQQKNHKVLWESPKKNCENLPFLTVKSCKALGKDTEYYYTERAGKDSIAFVLFSEDAARLKTGKSIGLIEEFKPPVGKFMRTAFGGSLDSLEASVIETLTKEVLEEAGYEVSLDTDDFRDIGGFFVSTQMNQTCYLFAVRVKADKFKGRQPENDTEAKAKVVWCTPTEVLEGVDWKAFIITNAILVHRAGGTTPW